MDKGLTRLRGTITDSFIFFFPKIQWLLDRIPEMEWQLFSEAAWSL